MKGVRFWGTRGSLPVALTAADVREKLLAALRAARGRPLASEADLEARPGDGLPFAVAGTYGGHSSCVQIDTGGPDFFVCDMGSGLRPFGQAATGTAQRRARRPSTSSCRTCTGTTSWALPFFVPAYIPGNRVVIYGSHADLEAALRRQQEPAVVPGRLLDLRRDARVRPPRARPHARDRRLSRHARCCSATPAIPYGYRFERRASGRLLDRFRASRSATGRARRALRRASSAMPTSSSSTRCTRSPTRSRSRRTGATRATSSASSCASWPARTPVPVPPRAGLRRRGDRRRARRDAPPRGDHPRRRRRCTSRRLRWDGNRRCDVARASAARRPAGLDRVGLVGVALSVAGARPRRRCSRPGPSGAAVGLVRRLPVASRRAQVSVLPVTVVEVDQKSLRRHRPVAVAAHPAGQLVDAHQPRASRRRSGSTS